ncbi:hypothetical protein K8I31_19090, partial [bacterium]|nr:hypothetical protein [bacterium]
MRLANFILILSLCAGQAFAQPVYQKGMSYTPWSQNTLLGDGSTQSIQNMSAAGVEWAALTVFWFQDDVDSIGPIEPDYNRYSASRESLVKAIQDMHANGIKVLLKPHVDNRSGAWRGEINPSEAWFGSYEDYIVDWAMFAEENGCDMLSIGCEYVKTTRGTAWEPQWRRIIASVREVYSGPLTYASNHGNETAIPWWDAVDYIGIDAYYPLTNEDDPTLDELRAVWQARANAIESWVERVWPDRPVIFTEIGYRSLD